MDSDLNYLDMHEIIGTQQSATENEVIQFLITQVEP